MKSLLPQPRPARPAGPGFFPRWAAPLAGLVGRRGLPGARRWVTLLALGLLGPVAQAQRPSVQLNLQASTGPADPTYVYFEAGATEGFDSFYDGVKLPNSSNLNLASVEQPTGQLLTFNGLPPALLAAPYTVPLAVGVPQAASYSLQVSQLRYFTSTQVFLTDALLQTAVPLDSGTVYNFELTAANTNGTLATGTRFALLFQPTAGPLPVTLTAFTAQAQAPGVALAWHTASEQQSAYFAVERSADGQGFAELGRVAAAGTSSQAHGYAFYDPLPLPGPGYYRLRQVDRDGRFTYSPVRVVAGPAAADLVFPNPARAGSLLHVPGLGAHLQVVNTVGQVVVVGQVAADGTWGLPAGLPSGVYLVRSGSQVTRLLVE